MRLRTAIPIIALAALAGFGVGWWHFAPSLLSPEGLLGLASGLLEQQRRESLAEYEAMQAEHEEQIAAYEAHLSATEEALGQLSLRLAERNAEAVEAEQALGRTLQLAAQREAQLRDEILEAAPEVEAPLEELQVQHRGVVKGFELRVKALQQSVETRDQLIVNLGEQLDATRQLYETTQARLDLAEARRKSLEGRRVRIAWPAVLIGGIRDLSGTDGWRAGVAVGIAITW